MPLAFAALAGATWGESGGWALFLLSLAFLLGKWTWEWGVLVLLFAVVLAWRAEMIERPVRESLASPMSQFVKGTLTLGGRLSPLGSERYGRLSTEEWERRVVVWKAADFKPGQVLKIKGMFSVPEAERNPGAFPKLKVWRRAGVFGALTVYDWEDLGWSWTGSPLRWAETLRLRMREGLARGLPEDSAGGSVVRAMVLGEKPPRDSEVSRAFRESGAMHVFAVSGLHVTSVGILCWLLIAWVPIPRRAGVFLVILAMLSYAMVTGLRPPAIRATVMAVCFLGAFVLRRRPSLFNALALSTILVIFWRPSQVHEVGFQLSYGVLLAIGLGTEWAMGFTGKIAKLDPFFPSRLLRERQRRVMAMRKWLAGLSASSLAAWLGATPLMFWHFGVVTPVAVLASVLLIPMTWMILTVALSSLLLGTVSPWFSAGVNKVNAELGAAAFYGAKQFAKIPFSHWRARRMAPADWIVYDCHDGGAASFLNVKEGAMIDVGSASFFSNQLKSNLDLWNVDLKMIFLTHPDGAHVGALPDLLARGGLEQVVLPVGKARSPTYRQFLAEAERAGCEKTVAGTGDRYDLGEDVYVEIIREGQPFDHGIADHRVMVMKVHWKGWRILVTGDLGIADEEELLSAGVDLGADVLLMGQHEWGMSGHHQFLEATGARIIIASAGGMPGVNMPKFRWFKQVRAEGYEVFNQWESGAVMLDFKDDELRVWSFLKPEQEVILQR